MINQSRPVWVYRNIHRKCYSVMQDSKVVAHCRSILLERCRFVVRPSGYARWQREKRKNVHAFVVGRAVSWILVGESSHESAHFDSRLRYSPQDGPYFRIHDSSLYPVGAPVLTATFVRLSDYGMTGVGMVCSGEINASDK